MYDRSQMQISMPFTPVVKGLMIANISIWFFLQVIVEHLGGVKRTPFFALQPLAAVTQGYIWQWLTYMFLHSIDWTHIVFNMLMLWWLGADLEKRWGGRGFLAFYLTTGVGAGFLYSLGVVGYSYITGNLAPAAVSVVGASGALFGLMLAFGILFGERIVHFMMIFPMKAKHFVMVLGAIQVVALMTSGVVGSGVSYLAHLTGLVSGFIYLWVWGRLRRNGRTKQKPGPNLKLVVDNNQKNLKYWN